MAPLYLPQKTPSRRPSASQDRWRDRWPNGPPQESRSGQQGQWQPRRQQRQDCERQPDELFGGYSKDGAYIVKKTIVKRELAKGEVKLHDSGCELDVFTFCLYHGEFSSVSDGSDQNGKPKTYGKDGVSIAGWEAACKKAATMMKECASLSVRAKVAKLRKCVKSADVRIKFEC